MSTLTTDIDYSTIDLDRLATLPVWKDPRRVFMDFQPSEHLGAGCYGDPPGFPTYFLQSSKRDRIDGYVIRHPGTNQLHMVEYEQCAALYRPLPFEHPRVQRWVAGTLQHFARCYVDTDLAEDRQMRADTYLFWPLSEFDKIQIMQGPVGSGTEEYRKKGDIEYQAITRSEMTPEAFGKAMEGWLREYQSERANRVQVERERRERICIPDNHAAVRAIRRIYPDYQPDPEQLAKPALVHQADWWERLAVRPTPEECAPPSWWGIHNSHQKTGLCRWCGSIDNVQE